MLPEAKNEDLVYVAGYGAGAVFVFAYPSGKPVGELTDIPEPIYSALTRAATFLSPVKTSIMAAFTSMHTLGRSR